jgi:Uncharacterised ACR, YagE family COG1723
MSPEPLPQLAQVLDTPEFFWSAPDSMQNLYKRVCEYMELDNRVEVLNNRLMVNPCASKGTHTALLSLFHCAVRRQPN